ncbi:aspartate/glutamate racemase family protein [Halotalea alkalilenta]|uniref:aspartate/glutamate racemase family protein n=1 Tax=Halotalea alkalilenta TaxID=376489 RepID=UPI000694D3A5|nr:aspartate/glutamate racemase family protein [Halotalea alkalilenta]
MLVPDTPSIAELDRIIFDELCHGELHEQSRRCYVEAIEALAARGAQGVILGCTEIGLLVTPPDTGVALYDTTRLHVEAAVEYALAG